MGRFLKIFGIIVGFLVVVGVFAFLFFRNHLAWEYTKFTFPESRHPQFYVRLTDKGMLPATDPNKEFTSFTNLGYTLKIPSQQIVLPEPNKIPVVYKYDSSKMVTLLPPPSAPVKDYDYFYRAFSLSVKDVNFFSSDTKVKSAILLFPGRIFAGPSGKSGIYAFQTLNGVKGFQFGDPTKGEVVVSSLFYDRAGAAHEIYFKNLTQEDINYVFASIE